MSLPIPAWTELAEIPVPEELRVAVGGHPLVAQVLARRGILSEAAARAFMDPQAYQPADPLELPGMQAAVERLQRAIELGEEVCVWGDFDVDGQTATTLLVSALSELGARVRYHIPIRAVESHGVNLNVLKTILDDGANLVVTCDTGIAAVDAAAYAISRGVDMIITDHHDLPSPDEPGGQPELPQACAVVNPKLLPAGHALAALPGVGVAYQLADELYRQAGRPGGSEQYLDLVALGIVADVALLAGDTRWLLQRGLEALRQNSRLGLQEIFKLNELDPAHLTEDHIGYLIAPRLNALGRLDDANPIVELLTTQDTGRARLLALQLEGLNARRRLLSNQVFQAARAQIDQDPSLLDGSVLVLSHPEWPSGVIGIVASRLVEHYQRPAVLISSPPGETGRGSARSIEGINITAAIAAHQDMLQQFGGHPMAAGLAIQPDRIPEFRRALSRTVQRMMGDAPRDASLKIDGFVGLNDLSLDLVADLDRLAPFGPGNPPLNLASRSLVLTGYAPVGRNDEHLQLTVEDEMGNARRVIWWQGAGWPLPEGRFDLAYSVRASTYRGRRDVQVEWIHARPLEQAAMTPAAAPDPVEVIDYRGEAHPLAILQQIQRQEDVLVWREGEAVSRLEGADRFHLHACRALVIWTSPAGPREFKGCH